MIWTPYKELLKQLFTNKFFKKRLFMLLNVNKRFIVFFRENTVKFLARNRNYTIVL